MSTHPDPRPLAAGETIEPDVLLLPAIAFDPPWDERAPWLEEYDVVDGVTIRGADGPLYYTDDGLAITTTGMGKTDAAATVAALFSTPELSLESTTVLSVGIAGGRPSMAPLGSVWLADAIVDWDRKHRWDPDEVPTGERADTDDEDTKPPIDPLVYRQRDYVYHVNDVLLERAYEATASVTLLDHPSVRETRQAYPDAVDSDPTVEIGTSVCGDEFWHGSRYAREVQWLCEQYGVGPYATTQMEDAATARVLERFGALGRYLGLRAVVNYDRPGRGQTVKDSFEGSMETLEVGLENLVRVGTRVVDTVRRR